MSKHDRKEVAKRLREQIEKTTDPEQLIKLTREYNRLTNPRYGSKAVKETKPSGKQSSSPIVAKWADRLSHVEPEAKRIEHSVILEVEERLKKRGIQTYPPTPESRALLHDVMVEVSGMLTAEERAVLNSGSPEVAPAISS